MTADESDLANETVRLTRKYAAYYTDFYEKKTGKKLPAGAPTRLAMQAVMKQRPELKRYIALMPRLSKLRNPERPAFWKANADLLDRYFGTTPTAPPSTAPVAA